MAKFRSIPRSRKMESYTGRLMVDTVRGILRVRKWPRKRGTPTHPTTLFWNDWFRQANLLAKYADPALQRRAKEMAEGTPMYPRDIMLASMRGRLYQWIDETGWKWYPMAGIQDISDALDALAQTVGSVLVRSTDRWRAPASAAVGSVLTFNGDGFPATWEPSPVPGASSGCLLKNSATWSIAAGGFTTLTWNQETYDDATFHDPAVNPSRITMGPAPGRVLFFGTFNWAAAAGGSYRQQRIIKNGSTAVYDGRPHAIYANVGGTAPTIAPLPAGPIDFAANDYFEVQVQHDAGGALTLSNVNTFLGCIVNA